MALYLLLQRSHRETMNKPVDDDHALRSKIESLLADDLLVDESKLDVSVRDGVVTVVGTVGTYAEKAVAQAAVRLVDGVHDLINGVTVKPTEAMNPSDAELTAMVESILAWDALVAERDIDVSVERGVVTLTGTCLTAAQAQEAERAISHLAGVQQLENRIEMVNPEIDTDHVRGVIAHALTTRAVHQTSQVDVIVDGGQVTLAGRTQSAMEKRAIIGAVSHAHGVSNVRDELTIASNVER